MIKGIDEADWNSLLRNIEQGDCTPLIGPGVSCKSLPKLPDIAQEWAHQYGYPLDDPSDLPRVAQFLAIRRRPMAPKEMLREKLASLAAIDFDADDEPHGVLADLPFCVYITTNYDDCLMRALKHRKRDPRRQLCKWNDSLIREKYPLDEPGFEPTVDEPLVFHLYGHYATKQSLVLTEDDYLDFLINTSSDNYTVHSLEILA